MDEDRIVLRSYSNLKNIKTKLYKLGNKSIWFPIEVETLITFFGALVIILIIDVLFKIPINPIYKFLAFPLGVSLALKTTKIDGKSPHIYLIRLLQYQQIRKKTIERFDVRENIKEIKFK